MSLEWQDVSFFEYVLKVYISKQSIFVMAATPPGAKKRKLDYMVDQNTFDEFMKACSRKGFAPQVVLEQAMRKFTQNGQI